MFLEDGGSVASTHCDQSQMAVYTLGDTWPQILIHVYVFDLGDNHISKHQPPVHCTHQKRPDWDSIHRIG